MFLKILCLLLALLLSISGAALALTRDELRAAWQEIALARSDVSPYLQVPDPIAFIPGALTEEAQRDALNCLNFLRRLAGLEEVELHSIYALRAQNAALLLAANDQLEHDAPRPDGMDEAFYESAHLGTMFGNIAQFNWMKPDILIDGVVYFARDDGSENLHILGHRRWLLNPYMSFTGFGAANSQSGMSYVTMYAVDMENADAAWDYIAWPAAQAFPVEMMRSTLPWSVSINASIYDVSASNIRVYLKEEVSGAEFSFDPALGRGDGFCTLSTQPYGSGDCIIFRPDLEAAGIAEYVQNQRWTVRITGLQALDGTQREITYSCEMVSLYPQDVANVELSQLEAQLAPGSALQLSASIIPAYADDLTILWGSDDPAVAMVNSAGLVTAIASGECTITAMSANGRRDQCRIIVE